MAKNVLVGAAEGTANLIEESGLPKATAVATQGAKNLAVSARDGVVKVGGAVLSPAVQLINATPLGSVFQTSPEEIAQRRRDREVRCAAIEASRADASIATLR